MDGHLALVIVGAGYLSWKPCPNCKQDWWREDAWVSISTRYRRLRLYCVCGYDEWPGGAIRPNLAEYIRNGETKGSEKRGP